MSDTHIDAFWPPLLPEGGVIALIQPSRWADVDVIEGCAKSLEARGYKVVVPQKDAARDGMLAGSDAQRANALMEAFADPSVDAIIGTRGGAGANLILDRLDYDLIKKNPKPFVGFSDVTALLNAITQQTGMITFHGPMARHFRQGQSETQSLLDLFAMIGAGAPRAPLTFSSLEVVRAGQAEGRLVGGNIALLETLIGTPYDWSGQDAILFIEEVEEPLYKIERALAHMRLAGKLQGVRAVLVGEMVGILDEQPDLDPAAHTVYGRTIKDIVLSHVPPDVPVVCGVPCGHGPYLTTFPVGAQVRVNIFNEQCNMTVLK